MALAFFFPGVINVNHNAVLSVLTGYQNFCSGCTFTSHQPLPKFDSLRWLISKLDWLEASMKEEVTTSLREKQTGCIL